MKMRPILGIAALTALALPTAAYSDDASDLRQQILEGCEIKAWQFSVRIESGGAVIPLLSPTMTPVERKCVLKMVDDYRRSQAAT
jgi:hypothetical protein